MANKSSGICKMEVNTRTLHPAKPKNAGTTDMVPVCFCERFFKICGTFAPLPRKMGAPPRAFRATAGKPRSNTAALAKRKIKEPYALGRRGSFGLYCQQRIMITIFWMPTMTFSPKDMKG